MFPVINLDSFNVKCSKCKLIVNKVYQHLIFSCSLSSFLPTVTCLATALNRLKFLKIYSKSQASVSFIIGQWKSGLFKGVNSFLPSFFTFFLPGSMKLNTDLHLILVSSLHKFVSSV